METLYDKLSEKTFFEQSKKWLQNPAQIQEIDLLRDTLRYHEWKYYLQNSPVLSDYEYDLLYKQLEELEVQSPDLITPDSPTQRVSSDLTSQFDSVNHLSPMLSLGNSYNAEDLQEFDAQIRRLNNLGSETPISYCVEPKFDGGSIALVYEDDLLARAATRGNGVAGDDITNNLRTLRTIPLRAPFSQHGIGRIELRGEAIIRKDTWKAINAARESAGLSLFANPRNTATGGLRTKDPKDTESRSIEAFIYQISYVEDLNGQELKLPIRSHFGQINFLGAMGFKIPIDEKKYCQNIAEAAEFCAHWEAKRESYPYEIDGMVVKVDDIDLQEKSGSTSHHPRWAIAYKFKAKQATSKLLQVEYQVGKIGSITPVAKIEPVQLAGVTVSSISLHNADFILSKDIRLGDQVLVERAGDVIPYIVKSLSDLRTGEEKIIEFPTTCPVCTTPLLRNTGEAAWRCPNQQCEAQVIQRLIHHVSKDAMDIDGFGKAYIEKFHELGWLQDMSDIYDLDYDAIARLEGFGPKSAENLKRAVEKAKHNSVARILNSLSIHHLGKRVAAILAQEVNHVLDLKDWSLEQFTNIKDIGPVVSENIIQYFSDPKNVAILERMESLGVDLHQKEEDRPKIIESDAPFINKTILFTGTLQTMGRKEAQRLATEAGAKIISAVSGNLDILVVGENAGSKLKKARELGTVEILTEEVFLETLAR